ncbi:hypothetical protein CspeluHIS016_0405670 [Cutaneotrichosporon spelunceum]|uniref:Uncharacterized protein n=1 Tax=Cutaneotrichosporon spelunceum TaxID=1672016 RepID=A0AAD3TVL2_9TREE|nr:hypothetical protein CspeluHIS016_0405670 [Cutaneotrichosporon spelunceum]
MLPPDLSSDPYDDDNFFDDPSTLAAIAKVEERAIAASQASKRTGYHHTVSRPSAGPRATLAKAPAPLNTNPRTSYCGMGWEQGGKFSTRVAQGLSVSGMARYNDDDEPMDVVVDDKGRYGFGSEDEPVYDQRQRPEIRQIVEAAAREKEAPSRVPPQVPGSQARREALVAALPTRTPITRTTSANALAGPSTSNTRLATRNFNRAASTGTATIGRAGSVGPSRPVNVLPTIGSQGNQPSSQGKQPSSQGATTRRTFFELEDERKRRAVLETELGTLRAQLEQARRQSVMNVPRIAPGYDDAARSEIEQLKQELYVAQGQAATAKRNQATLETRLHAEIDKLHADKREMENQMRVREHDNKQALDSAKTQMVFSNHQALTSAAKARQQSQWRASQRGPPLSPLRDKTAMTPAPLVRSAKGKTVTSELALVDEARDLKAELQHHLVTHIASSPLYLAMNNWYEPTFVRIMRYKLEAEVEVLQKWKSGQSRLSSVIGASTLSFEQVCGDLALTFRDMFVALAEAHEALSATGKLDTLADIDIDLLRLLSSTVLLFPTLPSADPAAFGQVAQCLNILSRSLNANSKNKLVEDWTAANMRETSDRDTLLTECLTVWDYPERIVERELGDAIAEAGEALCMADGKTLWQADDLSSTVLNLTMSEHPMVAGRGVDLFVAAACRPEHFRRLVTKSDTASGSMSLMDRMSRFLMNGHPKFYPEERFSYFRDVLRALAMLARSDENAVVLMTEGSILVPALAVILHRHSSALWSIRSSDVNGYDPLELITPTMLLLHHVVFPPPFSKATDSSQMPTDPDFTDPDAQLFASRPSQGAAIGRLLSAAASTSEFNGVQNFYVSALGPIAYTNADLDDGAWAYAVQPPGDGTALDSRKRDGPSDLTMVQYLAQDLLNAFVEGPEGDSVYEIYDTEEPHRQNVPDESEVIVISDDENFEEEEAMLGTWPLDD